MLMIDMFERIVTEFPYDILADDAIFELAMINEKKLKNKEKAMKYYEKILLKYNGSIYTAESRKRFRILRGDNLQIKP